ncbi:MAG: thioredoxin domain-containing protein, partial [Rectinemataceae bacterium]|nr:thioredoxin domain-containing protein [Rectinemataceae bacterium]
LVGALIIGGAFAFGQGGDRAEKAPEPVAVDIKDVKLNTSPSVGPKGAPVTIAVWFDYQCGFCKQFEITTLKEVMSTYGDKVRIVYKDFQFLGPASNDAAIYSRAVWEAYPDRWHEWFSGMFEGGEESTLNQAAMDALSTRLGLDVARINKLIADNRTDYQASVDADREEGQTFGINGTPGTIIGKNLLPGAKAFSDVKVFIDAELAK